MAQKFVIRFSMVLLMVLVLAAIGIQSFTSGEITIVMWIFAVPFILAIPILASVVLAKNEELGIPAGK